MNVTGFPLLGPGFDSRCRHLGWLQSQNRTGSGFLPPIQTTNDIANSPLVQAVCPGSLCQYKVYARIPEYILDGKQNKEKNK